MSTLLLLSGGMDSVLCLHRYGAALAIGFNCAQGHLIELDYARRIAKEYGVPYETVMLPPLPLVDDIVFAGRNAVFLSHAASIAQARGMSSVMIGCNLSDAARFPDCRPEFIDSMDRALSRAYGVAVLVPLLHMTKSEVVEEARRVGLPETWTCYSPINNQPCGECYSCKSLIS